MDFTSSEMQIQNLQYHRVPIDRENFPEQLNVEKIVQLVQVANENTAFVFNCQVKCLYMR